MSKVVNTETGEEHEISNRAFVLKDVAKHMVEKEYEHTTDVAKAVDRNKTSVREGLKKLRSWGTVRSEMGKGAKARMYSYEHRRYIDEDWLQLYKEELIRNGASEEEAEWEIQAIRQNAEFRGYPDEWVWFWNPIWKYVE